MHIQIAAVKPQWISAMKCSKQTTVVNMYYQAYHCNESLPIYQYIFTVRMPYVTAAIGPETAGDEGDMSPQ